MSDTAHLGHRIREARQAAGLTQTQLADLVGAHWVTVSNWERDEYVPSVGYLSEIANATGRPLGWLIEGKEGE